MNQHKSMRNVVHLALSAGLATSLGMPVIAAAQNSPQNPANLGKVEVTGTRIKRTDIVTSQPVVRVSREEIENSGLPSIGQLIQSLTSTSATQNASFNFESNGASNFDLRYLGSKRVLVLVNGRRFVTGLDGAADLNEIPTAIVDHIEILQDGASAIYGSDAISGVVNIITRKNFKGVEASAYRGIWNGDGHWDGLTQKYNATIGGGDERAGFTLTGSYEQQNGIPALNRSFSDTPVPGTGLTRGSSASPQGRFEFIPPSQGDISNPSNPPAAFTGLTSKQCPTQNYGTAASPEFLPFCDLTPKRSTRGTRPSDFKPFSNKARYNFVDGDSLLIPLERTNVYMQAHYKFLPSVKFHTSILYNDRQANTPAAPAPLFTPNNLTIPADQKYNPFGFELSTSEPVQVAPGVSRPNLSVLDRRLNEFPPRHFKNDVITTQFEAGLSGNFNISDRVFNWDVDYSFASNKLTYTRPAQQFGDRFRTAAGDPAACAAAPRCVPLDLFGGQGPSGAGTITPAQANYIAFTEHNLTHTFLRVADVNLNSSDIFDLPYGPLGIAIGYEHRENSGNFSPDAALVAGNTINASATLPTSGSITVDSAYAEINIPILADLPGAYGLDIDGATRYSDYDLFGSTTNSRIGVKWTPIRDLVIRATWSQGFRAPDINEAFSGQSTSFPTVFDPCSNYTQSGVGAAVQQRCAAAGVPASYVQSNQQINSLGGGNRDLKPETSISRTIGFVYSPSFVPGLSVNADYYKIDLEDAIQPYGAQNVIDSCYRAGNQDFCGRITRNSLGSVGRIVNTETNIGGTRTAGIDFGGRYKLPSTPFGDFTVHLQSSYVHSYNQFFPNGKGGRTTTRLVGVERAGFTFPLSVPRWKANAGVNWNYGNLSANLTAHFISGLTEKCTDSFDNTSLSLTNLGLCSNPDHQNNANSTNHLAAVSWYDLQVSYTTPCHFTVSVGANNLFARKPPRETQPIEDLAFDPTEYQFLIGRFIYGRITARF